MSDLLSQEEIDALLKAGLGGTEEEISEPSREDDFSEPAFQEPPYDLPKEKPGKAERRPPPVSRYAPADRSKPDRAKAKRSAKVDETVNVQPAQFESFEEEEEPLDSTNLEVILNLDLEIRVQLGKTTATVREVLEMGQGSVLELNKLNGEPVDLLVNQKPFSKGEMIVIGENFGVRVTDILSVPEIIEALR